MHHPRDLLGRPVPAYSDELSKTYATFAGERFLKHLRQHSRDTVQAQITTDLGGKFDGDTVHYHPGGFHLTIEQRSGTSTASTRPVIPTPTRTWRASTPTAGTGFFDAQHFDSRHDCFAQIAADQFWHNVARKNSWRGCHRPLDLLTQKNRAAPEKKISTKIFLLHPIALESLFPQPRGHGVPRRSGIIYP